MLSWLSENLGTIVVSVILIVIFGAAVHKIIKNKKSGKSSCGCGCSGCAASSYCHSRNNKGNGDL